MSLIVKMDMYKQIVPKKYLNDKQIGRLYILQKNCIKALGNGGGSGSVNFNDNTSINVLIDDDEYSMVISLVIDYLDKIGFSATLATKLITEYDAYHCHEYQSARTFIVISPKLKSKTMTSHSNHSNHSQLNHSNQLNQLNNSKQLTCQESTCRAHCSSLMNNKNNLSKL